MKLDISRNSIGAAGARAVADALNGNKGLTELNLADNRLGAEGVQHFLGAFQSMEESLVKFDISSNRFGAEGAKSLASVLEHNSVLRDLNVADNRMAWNARGVRDMSGVISFANTIKTMQELVRLVIKNNCLTNREGGEALASMLTINKSLRELNVSDNWKNTGWKGLGDSSSTEFAEELAAGLNKSGLSSLDLDRNSLPSNEMGRIKGICRSRAIALAGVRRTSITPSPALKQAAASALLNSTY